MVDFFGDGSQYQAARSFKCRIDTGDSTHVETMLAFLTIAD